MFIFWSFLLVDMRFTPSEGPKDFVNYFLRKLDHGSPTMEKYHLLWSDFIVHAVNGPLVSCPDHTNVSIQFRLGNY